MQKLVMYRLIADEGKLITNGEITGPVIDVAPNLYVNDFYEIDEPKEEKKRRKKIKSIDRKSGLFYFANHCLSFK